MDTLFSLKNQQKFKFDKQDPKPKGLSNIEDGSSQRMFTGNKGKSGRLQGMTTNHRV